MSCDTAGSLVTSNCTFNSKFDEPLVAGDWVAIQGNIVMSVLERRSALRRPSASGKGTQVLAANIDLVLLVTPIDRDLNVRVLERFAVMAYDSGATPLVILTKSDQSDDAELAFDETTLAVPGVTILTTSSLSGEGISHLKELLHEGVTAVMLGASGAGKTSLLNALEGTAEVTRTLGHSGEGRHATSTRRLYRLSSGGVLLDIPGIRLVDLLAGQAGIDETFSDIALLAQSCQFRNCLHNGDLGCAVEEAVSDGQLSEQRLTNWRLVQAETDKKGSSEAGLRGRTRRRRTP
jgi:ribosome biogenesis GTPase